MKSELLRSVKTPGAILMGLGSIIGTGLFVSLAIATQIAGNGVIPAILIAALLAAFNGLSSAQLAATYPVSGGTYEYGYRILGSYPGFTAGWMFVIAKTASAATAVLGCAGYLIYLFDIKGLNWVYLLFGLIILLLMTYLVAGGIRRSNLINSLIVSVTLLGLALLVIFGIQSGGNPLDPLFNSIQDSSLSPIFHASALMFVAYTGYGRIATLGEEVAEPRKTIPKAIILTMLIVSVLYLLVGLTALHVLGPDSFGATVEGNAAPLMFVAQALQVPGMGVAITISAITAMLGVLLNLLLGISRVILAMARRGDLPGLLSKVQSGTRSPVIAVVTTGILIGLLVLTGDVRVTWSFSAFTVLIYYAITNLSALFLPAENRLYPRVIPLSGLAGCLFLAFWIEPWIWLTGLGLIVVGLLWHWIAQKIRKS